MRQLEVLHKAGGLQAVAVGEHKFLHLRRRVDRLAEFIGPQGTVHQGHGHGFALAVAKAQAVAAGELWGLGLAASELVDHLALGDVDVADGQRKVQLLGLNLYCHAAHAHLADKWVAVGVATLRGVGHGQQKAFVSTRQVLQAGGAVGWKLQRLAREVLGRGVACWHRVGFDQPLVVEQVHHARGLCCWRASRCAMRVLQGRRRWGRRGIRSAAVERALRQQREVQQALGVVVGRPQDLAAGQVFEGG